MQLPDLSHLQMVVIEALGSRRLSGRELRGAMSKLGIRKSAPAFYQLMARLEEGQYVEGEYEQIMVERTAIKERFYRLTGVGSRAYHDTLKFYADRSSSGLPFVTQTTAG